MELYFHFPAHSWHSTQLSTEIVLNSKIQSFAFSIGRINQCLQLLDPDDEESTNPKNVETYLPVDVA
jgi:hypothetical protein